MDDATRHSQQTLLRMGDEFLAQYFVSAHLAFRAKLVLSRLFVMGHSIELYAKAALLGINPMLSTTHNVAALLQQLDSTLCLSAEECTAGETFFAPNAGNYDLGIYYQHREAMELYQAEHHLMNLKYYLGKNGQVIYPVTVPPCASEQSLFGAVILTKATS